MPEDAGKPSCAPGLNQCGGDCVDLRTDNEHCGACDKHCGDKRVCSNGKCEKAEDTKAAGVNNDVGALEALLALFGLKLSDLATELDVEESDLATTPITLSDLVGLGVSEAALGLFGFTADSLKVIGIDVSALLTGENGEPNAPNKGNPNGPGAEHGKKGAPAKAPQLD
jgi:hypothetical protein